MRMALFLAVAIAFDYMPMTSPIMAQELPEAACPLSKVATWQLHEDGPRLNVDAVVNGSPIQMLVDTGWAQSALTESTRDRLKLTETGTSWKTFYVDGTFEANDVNVRSILVGNVAFDKPTIHVARLPPLARQAGGVIGADFLSNYDVDFDLPNHQLTLYTPSGCAPIIEDVLTPVRLPAAAQFLADKLIIVRMTLNKTWIRALIDTGSTAIEVTKDAATFAGMTDDQYHNARPVPVIGIASEQGRMVQFDRLKIGDMSATAEIEVIESKRTDFSFIIGMQYLQNTRFWVSYKYERFIPLPVSSGFKFN